MNGTPANSPPMNPAPAYPPPVNVTPANPASVSSTPVKSTPVILQTSSIRCASGLARDQFNTNPFILKFKTKQIKVCQSCRRNYEGVNDTMGLIVARVERRMVSNLATGTQFLGRESNSHYHTHMVCLMQASHSFEGRDLVIPHVGRESTTCSPTEAVLNYLPAGILYYLDCLSSIM